MNDNFYVGVVNHKKSNKFKTVLYKDNDKYIDLVDNGVYSTNSEESDYVDESTLINIDVSELNVDYDYLLMRYKDLESINIRVKKKRYNIFKRK